MIHEFAIEPEVMATWEHFNVLWLDLGVERGRLLVEYPKNWRKRVHELVDTFSKPVRANAIRSRLSDPVLRRSKLVGACGRPFEGGDWLKNALAQQSGEQPFRAIVTRQAGEKRPDVLVVDDFPRDEEPWVVSSQCRCPRTAEALYAVVAVLLRHSSELILVDPHFAPDEPRFVEPFARMVGCKARWKRLELHVGLPRDYREEALRDKYERRLQTLIPAGTTLTVCLWPREKEKDKLHDRFVLTERGGVQFGHGLDEGEPQETTVASLLDHELFQELREDYHPGARAFGEPLRFSVTGRRAPDGA